MANDKRKSTVVEKIADHPAIAVAVGAAFGATVMAAGALALKNEKTKKKVEDVLDTVGEKVEEFAENMKEDAKAQLQEKTNEAVEDVKKVVEK